MNSGSISSILIILQCMLLFACIPPKRAELARENFDTRIEMDHLSNIYVISNQQKIQKFSSTRELLYEYEKMGGAKISTVDVNDPMKILVFYVGDQQVEILDNTLSPISTLDLKQIESKYFTLLSNARDGSYYLYDQIEQKLLKIDEESRILNESFPLYQEGLTHFDPSGISVSNQRIILADESTGIAVFDHLLNFIRFIPLSEYSEAKLFNDRIYYIRDNALRYYDQALHDEVSIKDIVDPDINNYYLNLNSSKLFLYGNDINSISTF